MFCNKCGKEIREGVQFCTSCGEPVKPVNTADNYANTANNQANYQTNYQTNYQSNANQDQGQSYDYDTAGYSTTKPVTPGKAKKPKMPLKTRIIAIAAAVAVIAGSGLFVWLNPYANNAFMKTILNSEDYTRYVIGKNLKKVSGNLTDENIKMIGSTVAMGTMSSVMDYDYDYDSYSSYSNRSEMLGYAMLANMMNCTADISAEVNLTDDIKDIIEDNMGREAENITWVDNAKITYSLDSETDKFGMGASANINNVDIASADVAMDFKEGDAYLSAPKLLPESAMTNVFDPEDEDYKEIVEMHKAIMDAIPDAKTTEELLTRYITCVLEQVEDVEEETEKLEVEDVSQKCTKLTINIDDKLCKRVAKAVLKEAKSDSQLKGIIKDVAKSMGEDPDDVIDSFEESIENGLENINEQETSGEDLAEVTLWVNSRGEIAGIDIEPEEGDVKFSAYDVKKGKKCASIIEMSQGRQKITFSGEGEIKRNKRSMDFSLRAMGTDIAEVSISNVDEKKLKKGLFNGTVEMKIAEDTKQMAIQAIQYEVGEDIAEMLVDSKLVIDGNMESPNKGKATIKFVMNNKPVIQLSVNSQIGSGGKVNIPANAEEYDEDDLEDEVDFDAIIDAFEEAGAPDDLIDEMEYEYRY